MAQQNINEINWKALALSGALALGGVNSANAQTSARERMSNHTYELEQQTNQNIPNLIRVTTAGATREDAIKEAQATIVKYCKIRGEKVLISYMRGYEPRVVSATRSSYRTNATHVQGEWVVVYEAIVMMSKKCGRNSDGFVDINTLVQNNTFTFENRKNNNMKKQVIRLTESDLHKLIKESVKRVIKETVDTMGSELDTVDAEVASFYDENKYDYSFMDAIDEGERLLDEDLLGTVTEIIKKVMSTPSGLGVFDAEQDNFQVRLVNTKTRSFVSVSAYYLDEYGDEDFGTGVSEEVNWPLIYKGQQSIEEMAETLFSCIDEAYYSLTNNE